ncbi:uncharacterized protein CIMG_00856 [Coccidioides immitis RS]|uniref:Uncharacterized protein n=1 Tax=Coccidioides immitis (strain RS) TaxID=246410 RepID=J3KHW8_COCIM|nr:uncharacterized protein CIMG_00856 [Coccidioides immitis RS]EAS35502.3 hypothetical protein CIMG_00856 [Coccidioides immitis RS]
MVDMVSPTKVQGNPQNDVNQKKMTIRALTLSTLRKRQANGNVQDSENRDGDKTMSLCQTIAPARRGNVREFGIFGDCWIPKRENRHTTSAARIPWK